MRSSPALLAALLVCTACPSPAGTDRTPSASTAVTVASTRAAPATTSSTAATTRTCEFIGARFVPLSGFRVQEHRESREPYSRVSLEGLIGTHGTVISIIPRDMRSTGEPTRSSQSQQYFESLRTAMASRWSEISERTLDTSSGSHPMILGRALNRGSAIDRVEDDAVMLLFPADFPAGKLFYVFFWTDIHRRDEQPNPLTELRTLVESFEVRTSPAGAPAGGCT